MEMKILLGLLIVLVQTPGYFGVFTSSSIGFNDGPYGGPYDWFIDEMTTEGTMLTTAHVATEGGTNIIFALLQSPSNQDNKFAIDASVGILSTIQMFDYEDITNREYNLTITAVDVVDGTTLESILRVFITDVDDTAPVITGPLSVDVSEDSVSGTILFQLQDNVNDVDSDSLLYSLIGDPESENTFVVDSTTGVLKLNKSLDYETRINYVLTLFVVDQAEPQNTATAEIIINVLDINDNPPVFWTNPIDAILPENTVPGYPVIDVIASDDDTSSALTYSITSGNVGGVFTLSDSTLLTSNTPLDFETTNAYSLVVEVTDGLFTSFAEVYVRVTDVEEPPVWGPFAPTWDDMTIYTVSNVTGIVMTAAATDPDNQGIYFTVALITGASGNPEPGLFVIDSTGILTMAAIPAETAYDVIIEATDFGSPALSIVRMVTIEITQDEQPPTTNFGDLGGVCTSDEDCLYPKGKAHCKVNVTAAAGSTGTCECYEQYYVQQLRADGTRDTCHRPKCTSNQVKTCTPCQQHFYKSGRNRCLACDPGYGTEAAGMTGEAACIPMANVPTTTSEQCYDLESCQTCMDGVTLALETSDICTVHADGVMQCLTSCPSVYMKIMRNKYFAIDTKWHMTSFTSYAAFSTAAQDLCIGV